MRSLLTLSLLLLSFLAFADELRESPEGPEHVKVYLRLDEALARAFPQADTLWTESWAPNVAERQSLETALGWHLPDSSFVFHRGARAGRELGYAMVTEEIGRFKPITFMVQLDPNGEVESVQIMVYRESRGDGVRRKRFLKQFHGKDTGDPLRLNRDITVLSGATLSSRSVTAGVKRVLQLVRARYLRED